MRIYIIFQIKYKIVFILLSILCLFNLVFAEFNITMKDVIYTSTNFVLINDLFEENFNIQYRIDIQTNTFIANRDIVNILNKLNKYNYIVLGKGTKVFRINISDKIDFFDYAAKKCPYFNLGMISPEEKKFLKDKFIIKVCDRPQPDGVCFDLSYLEFKGAIGEVKQHSIKVDFTRRG